MKVIFYRLTFLVWLVFSVSDSTAQNLSTEKNKLKIKSIRDIPHKTLWEKWMWVHRSIAFEITRERPIDYDTAYIKSYYKRLVITLPVTTRFLKFSLIDFESGNKLTFTPNLEYDLGISISSRWASFILNTGVKLANGDNKSKGKTRYQDYQLNLYGKKITTDMFVQYYSGFYIANSKSYKSYISDQPFALRADVNALHMGVSSYYILNNKRFSYGNSFAFVDQQKKSAGSLLLGVYYSYFEANGNPSLVSFPFSTSFDTLARIRNGHMHNFGWNLGYIYTQVFLKKCYATASVSQGVGAKQITYRRDDNSRFHQLTGGAGKLNMRLACGYNSPRYFIGAMGLFDYYFFRGKANATFDYSFGKFMGYIGYRFSVLKPERKLLHRLNLIDY